ncbi:hypothetical protein TI03_00630 [Achromatium sp. WMS1]|nr:hypothetical protein TI03_00630 [Achromatium sp. WMS1]
MRKILIAAVFVLFPLAGFAKDASSTETHVNGLSRILWVSAGVIGGVILVDMLVGGAMTAPVVSMMHPAVQQARAAGAVFGEQIAAATEIRDAEARASMAYAFLIGTGALLGGWLASYFVTSEPAPEGQMTVNMQ